MEQPKAVEMTQITVFTYKEIWRIEVRKTFKYPAVYSDFHTRIMNTRTGQTYSEGGFETIQDGLFEAVRRIDSPGYLTNSRKPRRIYE